MSSPIRMSQQRPIDKEFEDADDNGVLNLSGRNLRMFPNVPGELCDFADVFEAGKPPINATLIISQAFHQAFVNLILSNGCMKYHEPVLVASQTLSSGR